MARMRKAESARHRDGLEKARAGGPEEQLYLARPGRARGDRAVRLEDVIRRVLWYGSLVSAAIITAGVAMHVWSARLASTEPFLRPATGFQTLQYAPIDLPAGLSAGDPTAVVALGLLVLIATPVVRVASTVAYFLYKRDRTYLAITTFVLLVLLAGFAVGGAG